MADLQSWNLSRIDEREVVYKMQAFFPASFIGKPNVWKRGTGGKKGIGLGAEKDDAHAGEEFSSVIFDFVLHFSSCMNEYANPLNRSISCMH
jgi:hypothetical protein